ncbi:hypothetical protein THICB1_100046 [Thiomonas arsenitoxydans]|uniref:Uncharacterized protein n=1 Tax=Thiomonas arsenitoxydans (strain DSM 22701 / CIP 110005 / 3As) TaxID=426114 RepID=A0ABM9T169_THIA3|nr:hypothetical protein THICB2_590026 [Thiomonas sp. CB2]CQR26525.1 hypothetical protein THICB1_100046 [Thiomonas arsenitoxydans]VDY04035.1 protein of unknown function [Thiomonas sp. Bio17B3]VDY08794.1 protein of unknown function [Thiomonas sp. Sup16B3]VDY12282.1 conserved protein of unknown function [Thiomonas sp. OC7]
MFHYAHDGTDVSLGLTRILRGARFFLLGCPLEGETAPCAMGDEKEPTHETFDLAHAGLSLSERLRCAWGVG